MPKRVLPLTDKQISGAKAQAKEIKLFDGGGLYLLIPQQKYNSEGKPLPASKLWRLKYRHGGEERSICLGTYPEVTLAQARTLRVEARRQLECGTDPGEVRKARRKALHAGSGSFEVVAREWHAKFASTWTPIHAQHKLERLEKNVFPWIGQRSIKEITAPEALGVLRRLESRGLLDTAHRVRFDCGKIFRYAIATGQAERDPTADLKGALPPVRNGHFAAPTDPKNLAPLLRAIDGFVGTFVVKSALQIAPLVFLRPGELRAAEWSEFDLEEAVWNIPAERMKMKTAHQVPLSRQVVTILKELKPLTRCSRYVFPSARSNHRCMSENAVNAALRRMGFEKTEITGHGFRAVARTILDEVLGVRVDFIEHQLAHAVKDPNGRAYNRTAFLPQRREMMQLWADYLDGLKAGAKVIPFKKAE